MPNIATVFKTEISRIIRKELRAELAGTKKVISSYRSQIAELKRKVKSLETNLGKPAKGGDAEIANAAPSSENGGTIRFSAKSLASQRRRLGLTTSAAAKILGVSAQSITNWEKGLSRPREKQLETIAELRKMGKKEAAARLVQ